MSPFEVLQRSKKYVTCGDTLVAYYGVSSGAVIAEMIGRAADFGGFAMAARPAAPTRPHDAWDASPIRSVAAR